MTAASISERAGKILATLVREYIESAEPVGSSVIVQRGGFGVSSATVRNTLAELEEAGYVRQPHTSAGRVPTDLGYRFYVDLLLEGHRPARTTTAVEAQLRRTASGQPLMDEVLTLGSHMLSRVSGNVGFALPPGTESARFHHIEFVSLSASRILVVLVTTNGQVTQKIVEIDEAFPSDELHEAARYLNTEFNGLALLDVRSAVVERLRQERTLYNALFSRALRLARSTFDEAPTHATLFVDGTSSLLDETAQGHSGVSLATLRALLRMVEEKQRLVRILNEYIDGPGMTVVIGAEHRTPDLRHFSLVAATYFDGNATGTVGIIGPTRMRYSRAIAVVDGVAHAVTRMLRGRN